MAEFTDADIKQIRYRLSLDGTQERPATTDGDWVPLMALMGDNVVIDDRTYTNSMLTGCVAYHYDTKADAELHDKSTGLLYRMQWTFEYSGSALTKITSVRIGP